MWWWIRRDRSAVVAPAAVWSSTPASPRCCARPGSTRTQRVPGCAELERRAGAGDARAVAAVDEAGRMLGRVLSGAVNLLDPEAVVLGGIYRGLMPWLSPPADRELTARVVSGLWSARERTAARLLVAGDAARGAAALVVQDVLADPVAYVQRETD